MLKWIQNLFGGDGETPTPAAATKPPLATAGAPAQGPLTTTAGEAPSPIARQIILDRAAHILGYEFMLRSEASRSQADDPAAARVGDQRLIRTIITLDPERIGQFREIWLALCDTSLLDPLLEGLPAKSTVVLVRTTSAHPPTAEILERAAVLTASGFRLGLLGFTGTEAQRAWLPSVTLVALDTPSLAPDELGPAVRRVHDADARLKVVARKVDSYEAYEFCHAQTFDAFAGRFLTRRENWPPQPTLNSDRVRLCQVLNQLRSGMDLNEVAGSLRLSPEIAYRFLRYINSAGMGLTGHIASIEQGCLYLGREKLYRWLTLLLFSAADGQVTDRALLEQALTRGRMLEMMGKRRHLDHLQCDELFVVGIFSLFDVLLGLPLDLALRPLQLPRPVAGALLEGSGLYAPYLRLVVASENTEGNGDLAELAKEAGMTVAEANENQLEAVAWAQQLDPPNAG